MFIPSSLRAVGRRLHRALVFRSALRRFRENPEASSTPGGAVLRDLVYGWNNDGWSAQEELLLASIQAALRASGSTLECGSGLSTVLLGIVAEQKGHRHVALEQSPEWATHIRRRLHEHGVVATEVLFRPLVPYGECDWYRITAGDIPDDVSLVVCDGPPGETRGGRDGLITVLRNRKATEMTVLIDDVSREAEALMANRWQLELGGELTTAGSNSRFAVLKLGRPPESAQDLRRLG